MKNINTSIIHPEFCSIEQSEVGFNDIVLPKDVKEGIIRSIKDFAIHDGHLKKMQFRKSITGLVPVLLFEGMPGTGKSITAKALAHELVLPMAVLRNLDGLKQDQGHHLSFMKLICDLNEEKCLIIIDDFDKYLDTRNGLNPADVLSALESSKNPIVLTVNNGHFWGDYYPINRRITRRFLFPIPGAVERRKIWKIHLPKGVTFASEKDFERTVKYFLLTGGNIKNAIASVLFGSGNVREIEYGMLLPHLVEEGERITGYLSGIVRICSGQELHTSPEIISQFDQMRLIIGRQDVLSTELPAPLAVGILTEMDTQTIAINMAHAIGMPVLLRTYGDDDLYEREERALSRTIIRSLPEGEFITLHRVNETEIGAFFNKRMAKEPVNFILITNRIFSAIHPGLQFCLHIKKAAGEDYSDLARQLQEMCDFKIFELCSGSRRPAFLRFLRFLWIMEGGRRLGFADAEKALDSIGRNGVGRQSPLFGDGASREAF